MDINGMIGEIDDKPVDLGIGNFPTNSYGDVDLMYYTYRLPSPPNRVPGCTCKAGDLTKVPQHAKVECPRINGLWLTCFWLVVSTVNVLIHAPCFSMESLGLFNLFVNTNWCAEILFFIKSPCVFERNPHVVLLNFPFVAACSPFSLVEC